MRYYADAIRDWHVGPTLWVVNRPHMLVRELILGLFCRIHCQLYTIVFDSLFHERKMMTRNTSFFCYSSTFFAFSLEKDWVNGWKATQRPHASFPWKAMWQHCTVSYAFICWGSQTALIHSLQSILCLQLLTRLSSSKILESNMTQTSNCSKLQLIQKRAKEYAAQV